MRYASLFLPLQENFRNTVGDTVLPNKVYKNETPSDVRPIAEYEEMGGVVIAYPGTPEDEENPEHPKDPKDPNDPNQLPPTKSRKFGIPNELIVRMQQLDEKPDGEEADKNAVHIFILCADQSQLGVILKDLGATAKELGLRFREDLVHLVPWDTDTYWTRDYAPWWIFNGSTQQFGIAKHRYTTLGGGIVGKVEGAEDKKGLFRPNDDYSAVKLSDFLSDNIRKWNKDHPKENVSPHEWYDLGLLNAGGNYMSTTTGVVASSYLISTQNKLPEKASIGVQEKIDKSMEYVLSQYNRFMGVHKYIGLSDPTKTYIGHIDCWGKFISDSKVVIADSKNQEIKVKLDEIAAYLEQEGFTVYRIMCQPIFYRIKCKEEETTASYVNCFILNKVVYVPITGDPTYDNAAIKVFKDALGEEYTIIGILGKKETPWLGTDSIHCRTREIPRTVVNNWKRCQTSSFTEYKIRKSYLQSIRVNLKSASGNLRSVSGNLEEKEPFPGIDALVKVPYIQPAALKLTKKHVDNWSVLQIENDNETRLYAVPVPSQNSYIWVSDVPIDENDVANVYKHIRKISQTSTIHINSGTHGDEDGINVVDGGARFSDFNFFLEDLHTITDDKHTSIHVISSYAPEIYPFKNANHIILAWCYSIKTLARTEKMQDFLESWEQPREAQEVHLELDDIQNYYYQTMLPEKTVYATNPKHVFAVEKRHFQQK